MKALGIDYGEARIGLAASDDLGMFAHPLETIDARAGDPMDRIAEVVAERGITTIVVGMPLRMDGTRGPAAQKVSAFIDKLRTRLGAIELIERDERLTTVEAQRALHEAGRNVKNSRKIIDQAAAALILQSHLDRLALEAGTDGEAH